MCEQLPALARALGRDPTAAALLPELLELAMDEEADVRCSAVQSPSQAPCTLKGFFLSPCHYRSLCCVKAHATWICSPSCSGGHAA
jgi:hypothetical protein